MGDRLKRSVIGVIPQKLQRLSEHLRSWLLGGCLWRWAVESGDRNAAAALSPNLVKVGLGRSLVKVGVLFVSCSACLCVQRCLSLAIGC